MAGGCFCVEVFGLCAVCEIYVRFGMYYRCGDREY